MEAGYDYLLLRSKLERHLIRSSAVLLLIIGGILLSAGVGYFVYAEVARSGLDKYNYVAATSQGATAGAATASNPSSEGQTSADIFSVVPSAPSVSNISQGEPAIDPNTISSTSESGIQTNLVVDVPLFPVAEVTELTIAPPAIPAQQLYPGEVMKARYWSNPLEYEPASYVETALIQGFKPIDPLAAPAPGTLPAPSRIIIPSINVDSDVAGLAIRDLGDSRAYETPKHVVGHIPTTANPGEKGSTWLFGHLESPIAGEGNVFYDLPKIPDLLRKGEDVFVIVENGKGSFLYKVQETRVVHEDDLKLFDSGSADVHLVVCVPRFVYDHRLVVTGELVGAKT